MVQKIVDATQKHSRRYGCEALNPLQYETGRNTQENREPVSAALKKRNSRNDSPISLLLHTNPLRRRVLRRHVVLPRRKNNIYGSQQDRVRHPRRAIQIAGESLIRDAELQSCRFDVAHLGDYVLKNGLPGGGRRQVGTPQRCSGIQNLDDAGVSVCTVPHTGGYLHHCKEVFPTTRPLPSDLRAIFSPGRPEHPGL